MLGFNKNKKDKTKKQDNNVSPKFGVSSDTKQFSNGVTDIKDIIAPESIYVDFNHLKIGNKYFRSIFVSGYPRYVGANWLSPVVTFEHPLEISMFYYPVEAKGVLDD